MIHTTYKWKTYDNINLFAQSWIPKSNVKCVICIVHGIGEHSTRYNNWAKKFVEENIAVLSYDKRGQGKSDGDRGKIPSYESLLLDTDVMLEKANQLFPNIPCVLYGHSMGGGEVLNHLLKRKAKYLGVISTSPWIVAKNAPSKFLMNFIRIAYKILPNFTAKTSFNADNITQSEEEKHKYIIDKLIHHTVSLRLFVESYDAGYWCLNNANNIQKPLLLLHGDADNITCHKASQEFSRKAGKLCQLKLWAGGYHELHNEPFNNDVFKYIINWLDTKIL